MSAGHLCVVVVVVFLRDIYSNPWHIKKNFFCHFVLSSKSYLYILDARLLSDS